MRAFDLDNPASLCGEDCVLGMRNLYAHSWHISYGTLRSREGGRLILVGDSHEEILCAATGPLEIQTSGDEMILDRGRATHASHDGSFLISNPSERSVIYLVAGARS